VFPLKLFLSIVLASAFFLARSDQGEAKSRSDSSMPDPTEVLKWEKIRPKGQWYETRVPDTLDLAERAKWSISVLTNNMEPKEAYSVYQGFNPLGREPGDPRIVWGLTWNISPKNARALPMLRVMNGSDLNLDQELNLMRTLIENVHQDGLMYYPVAGEGVPKGTSYPYVDGVMALALLNWHARDNNPAWLKWFDLMVSALKRVAIVVDDRAYYPPESGYLPDGTWHWNLRPGKPLIPYTPPNEPEFEQQGLEGCVKFEQASPLRALVKSYQINGNAEYLTAARQIARFCLKPGMWEDTSAEGYPGNEHGIFAGHFHGNVTSLHALLDLAIAEDNDRLKQLVREAYDHGRRSGVVRIGWFPYWLRPEKHNRKGEPWNGSNEACGTSDMLLLAVKLTDAGLGDYWDDVDSIVRNHLIEQQFINEPLLLDLAGRSAENQQLVKRFLGGFGQGWVTANRPRVLGCCSANGAIGLYYAWHGITRFDKEVATVNLLLNRASAWMDVDSYLPYEGKVVLHNKRAHTALIRLPNWLQPNKVMCFVNDKPQQPVEVGRYLMFNGLVGKEDLRLEFPVLEQTSKYTINDIQYTVSFRGSTVIDIAPRDTNPARIYPFFQRERFRANKAPMLMVKRFVPDRIIPLQ
jgi:hypothetical protein